MLKEPCFWIFNLTSFCQRDVSLSCLNVKVAYMIKAKLTTTKFRGLVGWLFLSTTVVVSPHTIEAATEANKKGLNISNKNSIELS